MLKNAKLFDWIGGKKWLSKHLNEIFNDNLKDNKIKYYLEPFAGGLGSAIFSLEKLKEHGVEEIFLNDINCTIISIYNTIKIDYSLLLEEYWKIEKEYQETVPEESLKLKKTKDKVLLKSLLVESRDYYMTKRAEFNEEKAINPSSIKTLTLFLFISKHCFNGVYRENSKGGYNSPFNWEQGIVSKIDIEKRFKEHHIVFNEFNITFENMNAFDFIEKHKHLSEEALFYFDPPYLNESIGENKYNKDHFGIKEQNFLLEAIKELDNSIFSNHLLPIFENFCRNNSFLFETIERVNRMASNNDSRKKTVSEILAFRFK